MKVSVVISTYNGVNDLGLFFESLHNVKKNGLELEIIIRDDNSIDQTCAYIKEKCPEAYLIPGKENLGFVRSNNIAFRRTTGDIICCLNQDTILEENFFLEALNTLNTFPGCTAINTNMIMPWVMSVAEFRRCKPDEFPAYEYQLTRYGYIQYVEVEKKERIGDFMTGGAFFMRRSVLYDSEDLFDEQIDAYCEDTELSLRVADRGGKIVFCPKAVVYHNQVQKQVSSLHGLAKLLKITRNRFSLFARMLSPSDFSRNYPLYLAGIIKKMSYLGLSSWERRVAYVAGAGIAFVFFLLFPCWLFFSLQYKLSGTTRGRNEGNGLQQ
jgi:GT2 family glycosyltransferase